MNRMNEIAKVDRRIRVAFFGAMAVIVLMGFYNRIVSPHIGRLFALNRYEQTVDRVLAESEDIEKMVSSSRQKLDSLAVEFAQVRNSLFTPGEAEEFFSDLQAISVETDCPIYSLNFVTDESSAEKKEAEQVMGIVPKKAVLSVAGVYENIIKLIDRLQHRSRKVWIEGVHMEAISDNVSQIKCDIMIKIYTMQNKEAALYE